MLDPKKLEALLNFIRIDLETHCIVEVGQTLHGLRYAVDIGDGDFDTTRHVIIEKAQELGLRIAASTNPDDDLGFTVWQTR